MALPLLRITDDSSRWYAFAGHLLTTYLDGDSFAEYLQMRYLDGTPLLRIF